MSDKEVLAEVERKPRKAGNSKVINIAPREFKALPLFRRFLNASLLKVRLVRDPNVWGGVYIEVTLAPDWEKTVSVRRRSPNRRNKV